MINATKSIGLFKKENPKKSGLSAREKKGTVNDCLAILKIVNLGKLRTLHAIVEFSQCGAFHSGFSFVAIVVCSQFCGAVFFHFKLYQQEIQLA